MYFNLKGEHWAHHQSTLIPIVVYTRETTPDGKTFIAAHSEVIISGDLNHSNQMVKHSLEKVILKYKQKNADLIYVHLWSE